MKCQTILMLCAALISSQFALAATDKKSILEAIDQMMADLPPESSYHAWLIENGPVYGNYCGPDHGDRSFEAPCLSRMDCICKAHDFGSSMKHYLESAPGKVDEKGGLRKKIEDISAERARFEERAVELHELQELQPNAMSLSTQPFSIIAGLFAFDFEKRISRVLSLRFGTSFLGSGLITDTYLGYSNNKDFSVFGSVGLKTFLSGETLNTGIYLEPFVDFGYENIINRTQPTLENVRDVALVPALLIGAEKVFLSGLKIDAGIGLGMHIGIPLSAVPEGFSTYFVVPKFRASIGYAW